MEALDVFKHLRRFQVNLLQSRRPHADIILAINEVYTLQARAENFLVHSA